MKANKNKRFLILFVSVVAATVFILQSFGFMSAETFSNSNDKKWPSKRELRTKLWRARKILWVYGTGNPDFAAAYRKSAENSVKVNRHVKIIVKPDTVVTLEDIKSIPLSLIGTPASNSLLGKVAEALPIDFKDGRISMDQMISAEENDVLSLRNYPNPLNPSMPIYVTTGNNDASIVAHLSGSQEAGLFPAGDFVVYRNRKVVLWGLFKQENNGPWEIDSEETRSYFNNKNSILNTENYAFSYLGNSAERETLAKFARKQEARFANLADRLNLPVEKFPQIKSYLYESPEDKGLITRNTDLSHIDLQGAEVHTIFNGDINGGDFYSDAKLLIAKFIGDTKSIALKDGLAIYFSEGWGKHGYRYWAKKFYDTGNVNPLGELLDSNIYKKESYLFMRPLAGSFVAFLVDKYGWTKFLDLYKNWPASGLPKNSLEEFALAKLEHSWRAYLKEMKIENQAVTAANHKAVSPRFQKGFCHAHEGYQIYNGYISRKSAQALGKLRELGTNWISLTPFGYLQDRNKPGYFNYSFGSGSENDESIITSFYAAKNLGMGVMLKPHVLMSSGNWGWPGEVEMKTEQDWQKFFKYYTGWIRHYALLAEMYGIDSFCIGVELLKTTRDHQEEWREVIAKVRQIYSGPIVYAANWGEEFEQIEFWDELDYIGLNCYYPLSDKEEVTLTDLKKGAAKFLTSIEKVAKKYQKPVLLTEVGFCSREKTWRSPHERGRSASPSFEHQALAYRAIFESFWDKDWFYGFYWWKWPTYLEYGGLQHSGFTPAGKPAEKVVKEWYSKTAAAR